ncbi:hypothetical protein OCK74_26435 [Chitinophagaceae bacterium LB-8]|uniref:Uncharacterized protein n=1 Tax=Paraflavisolibacter caeni TaxID=2982496 RepID=A0A9X2Y068_9BACT|nr:hypothetical protein [Paraflavisolibacter caeni]MCU7552686.1 hypothetical protein [Paraflavisolibacter caeni]
MSVANNKRYIINSRESVKNFLYDLQVRVKKEIAPEDDFFDYKDEYAQPVFTQEEAEYLDDVMLYCYIFCMDNSLDIHEIAEEVWCEIYL